MIGIELIEQIYFRRGLQHVSSRSGMSLAVPFTQLLFAVFVLLWGARRADHSLRDCYRLRWTLPLRLIRAARGSPVMTQPSAYSVRRVDYTHSVDYGSCLNREHSARNIPTLVIDWNPSPAMKYRKTLAVAMISSLSEVELSLLLYYHCPLCCRFLVPLRSCSPQLAD